MDVSGATPEGLPEADRPLRAPAVAGWCRAAEPTCTCETPLRRQIARRRPPIPFPRTDASVAVSLPREQSIGTRADVLPRWLQNRPPTYPRRARLERLEGTVVLRLHVTAEGTVGKLEIASSSGFEILDAAAVEAVRSAISQMIGRQPALPDSGLLPVQGACSQEIAR